MPQEKNKDAVSVFTVYRITLVVLALLALSGFAAAGYYAGRCQMLKRMLAEEHDALSRLQMRFQSLMELRQASRTCSKFESDTIRPMTMPLELPSPPDAALPDVTETPPHPPPAVPAPVPEVKRSGPVPAEAKHVPGQTEKKIPVKVEVKFESLPDPKPVVKPVVKAEPKPVVQPVVKADPKPVVKPVVKADPKPVVQPVSVPQETVAPAAKQIPPKLSPAVPAVSAEQKKTAPVPAVVPAVKPVAVPAALPSAKPVVEPVVEPVVKPVAKPVAKPEPVPAEPEKPKTVPLAPAPVIPAALPESPAPVPVPGKEAKPVPAKNKEPDCSEAARKIIDKKMQNRVEAARLLLLRIGEGDLRDVEMLLANGVSISCAPVLHPAVKNDRLDMTLYLLSKGAAVDARAKNRMTALHLALLEKRAAHADVLIRHGADLFPVDSHGKTPLVYAIESNMMSFVKLLMERGAPKTPDEMAAAMVAALRKPEIMTMLMKKGGSVNQKYARGRTLLHFAAENNWCDSVTFLLDHGAGIDGRDDNGMTPLHLAVSARRGKAAELLLARKAAVDPFSNEGTPLHIAVMNASDMIPLLMLYNAKPTLYDLNGMTALLMAVKNGNAEAVQLLLKSGTPIRQTARDGRSVLHVAAQENRVELAPILIRAGADIEARDANGKTPVFYAFGHKNGDVRFLNTMIRQNASLNVVSISGETPVHAAALAGDLPALKILRKNNVDLNARTKNGRTILHFAVQAPATDALRYLVAGVVPLNVRDAAGVYPAHLAAQNSNPAVLRVLKDRGADLNQTDKDGHNALYYAAEAKMWQNMRFLLEQHVPMTDETVRSAGFTKAADLMQYLDSLKK